MIVEMEVAIQLREQIEAAGEVAGIDEFVFQRAPEALDENVVQSEASSIHADRDAAPLQRRQKVGRGELQQPTHDSQRAASVTRRHPCVYSPKSSSLPTLCSVRKDDLRPPHPPPPRGPPRPPRVLPPPNPPLSPPLCGVGKDPPPPPQRPNGHPHP